ncbi:hypothetical protein ACT3SZ_04285 [Corynebacterium sp. AOP40-9SA-29]|uniref:hypothetical protein n=1 Tax=Corynebacterium sp. AOP40-9SA-29 TaxID=3457677 RepID=UPI004034A47E
MGRSARPLAPLSSREFRIVAATTLGDCLVRDLVKRTWPRRIGQTAVVATGAGLIMAGEWEALSDAEREQISTGIADLRESLDAGPVPGTVTLVAGTTVALGVGAWVNGKLDAAGAAVVTAVGGRIPLVGRVFRALPSTTFGAAQVGVLYVLNERARG